MGIFIIFPLFFVIPFSVFKFQFFASNFLQAREKRNDIFLFEIAIISGFEVKKGYNLSFHVMIVVKNPDYKEGRLGYAMMFSQQFCFAGY